MAIQDDSTVLCKGDLKAYHESILPYLGGNMALSTNVSDYYSTDEKIVGVWIDGKPLYQKTIDCGNLAANTIKNVKHNISNIDKVIFCIGAAEDGYKEFFPIPDTVTNSSMTAYTNLIMIICDTTNFVIRNKSDNVFTSIFATIKYTKATDIPNSAVTTTGCYDINFPNTWPENKEIYFGNGLYGQRFTGTFNANTTDQLVILKRDFAPATLIECGGVLKRSIVGWYDFCVPYYYSGMYGSICINSDGHLALCEKDSGAISNCPYDVWVTYTK